MMADATNKAKSSSGGKVTPQTGTKPNQGGGSVRIPKDLGGEAQPSQKSLKGKGTKRG